MLHALATTLKSILDDTSTPSLVRNAEVAFDRPSDTYNPDKTTINLFLYDVRENNELRSNEPVIERQNGIATIRRAPLRVNCSYLVTAWVESGVTGEQAVLKQHELLGEVLRVFSRWPSIPLSTPDEQGKHFLQGELKTSLYPLALVTAQTDLGRNPAEFWTAIGGKLRPSFTVMATIALEQELDMVTAPEVSSKIISVRPIGVEEADVTVSIGGRVRDGGTQIALPSVELTLEDVGLQTLSDTEGRFHFAPVVAGQYVLQAKKEGYQPGTKTIQIPGTSPTAFDIEITAT